MLYAILKVCVVAFMRLYFRIQERGLEHVPRSGPALLVANHSSVIDPPLIGGMAPRPISFLAKAELFEIPLLGPLIKRLNAHPVRRDGADPAALRTAMRVLEGGGALLVFPEGTRGQEGVLRPGKPGAGMLALLSGAPVVPVYVKGSGRAWPRGRRIPRPTKVTVAFGPPLRFAGEGDARSRKESYGAASQAMMAAIARLKDAAESAGPCAASPREVACGGVGVGGASTPSKSMQGRNGQYGEG